MTEMRILMFAMLFVAIVVSVHRALGRITWRMTMGSVAFIASRKPVVLCWLAGALGFAVLILPGVMANGGEPIDLAITAAICLVSGGGIAALVVMPIWMLLRAKTPEPTLSLDEGEEVISSHKGNHYLAGESRGGKILITNRRLAFQPHKYNVQLDVWSVPLERIDRVEAAGARGLVVWEEPDATEAFLVVLKPDELSKQLAAVNAKLAPA